MAILTTVGFGVTLGDDFAVSLSDRSTLLPQAGDLLLLAAEIGALVFRRIAPLPVLAFTVTASLVHPALHHQKVLLPLPLLVALYTVAVVRRPLMAGVGAGVYLVGSAVSAVTGWATVDDQQFFTHVLAVVGPVMVGYGVALSRTRTDPRRADSRPSWPGNRRAARDGAVEQEQARIAREVHDIVAHDLSVMVAQAAAARRVFRPEPQTWRAAALDLHREPWAGTPSTGCAAW